VRVRHGLDETECDPVVDAYISRLGRQEQATLTAWRERCLELPNPFVEAIRHGMPYYSRDGEPELAFASQKRHLASSMMRGNMIAAFRNQLEGYSVGKGCIRFPRQPPSDLHLVGDLGLAGGAIRWPIY